MCMSECTPALKLSKCQQERAVPRFDDVGMSLRRFRLIVLEYDHVLPFSVSPAVRKFIGGTGGFARCYLGM